jgi:hypothetical protein
MKFRSTGSLTAGKSLCLRAIQLDKSETSSEDRNKNERSSIGLFYNGNNPIREMIDRAGMDISSM